MSVRCNASGESLSRTTSLPSPTAFTMCGWSKITRIASQYQFWGIESSASNAGDYTLIGYDNNGSNQFQIVSSASGGFATFGSSPTDETWFFWAITCSGTASNEFKGYWAYQGAGSFNTAVANGAAFTAGSMTLGNDSYDEYANASYAHVKVYDRALSSAELLTEMGSASPVSTTNIHLYSALPSTSDVTDTSGNSRNWTSNGTLSSETSLTFGGSPTVEQEGYRFRNDDGSETAATWLAAQDTDVSLGKNRKFRIRAVLNGTGDPANTQFQLEFRKVGSATWKKVQ